MGSVPRTGLGADGREERMSDERKCEHCGGPLYRDETGPVRDNGGWRFLMRHEATERLACADGFYADGANR